MTIKDLNSDTLQNSTITAIKLRYKSVLRFFKLQVLEEFCNFVTW